MRRQKLGNTTEKFKRKVTKGGPRDKYFSELTKWHGENTAPELIRNTKNHTKWRSMIANAIQCIIIKVVIIIKITCKK